MSHSEAQIEQRLRPVVEALRHGLGADLTALALFGSRARGDATPESDWDILLIARDLPARPLQRHFHVKALLPEHWRARVSILAKTSQEFEARLPSLYLDIALDAVVLYDPQGYLRARLADIRRAIARLNLQRERQGRDLIWRGAPMPWSLHWEELS